MFDNFTASSRRVMQRAFREAKRCQHDFVGTEHLLYALLREESGPAYALLREIHAKPDLMLDKVELSLQQHPIAPDHERVPLSPALRRVFESAETEAAQFRHQLISPEHLLLGLAKERECEAAQVIANHGIVLNELRVAVARLPMDSMPEAQVQAGTANRRPTPDSVSAADLEEQVMPIHAAERTTNPSLLFATPMEVYSHLRRAQYALGAILGFVLGYWTHNWVVGLGIALFAIGLVYFQRFWINILICAGAPLLAAISTGNWPMDRMIFVPLLMLIGAYVGSLLGAIWLSDRTPVNAPVEDETEEEDHDN